MRLDFNVLWVDDQPGSVFNQIKSISLQMAAEGFEFKPRQCTTLDQVEAVISEDVFTDEVDLILVDWDLGNGAHGEDAIRRIREDKPNFRRHALTWCFTVGSALLRREAISLLL